MSFSGGDAANPAIQFLFEELLGSNVEQGVEASASGLWCFWLRGCL
jgi:hypothetical protein